MNKLNFLIVLMAITAFAQSDGGLIAPNTAGFCNAEALVTKIEGGAYAIVFEGEGCLQPGNDLAAATINGKRINDAWRIDRKGAATLYYLGDANGLKDELCATGEIQGATVNTPLGIMTATNRTETFIQNNGCVVAMKASEGLYINATELRIFASSMPQAFYRIGTRCGATNVCGVGLVTAAHCVMGSEQRSDTIKLWDGVGDSTLISKRQAKVIEEKSDYAIFPQIKERHCIPPIAGNLRQGEVIYLPTFGKAGPKMVTSAYRHIDGDGDMAIDRATISLGNSGTGAVTRKGEFAGIMINATKTFAYMRGMEQIRNVSDLIKVK